MTCASTTGKARLAMKPFIDLTGALFLYLTGRNLISSAPFLVYLPPTQAPANHSAGPGTALAGGFLPISFGRDCSLMAASNHYQNLGSSIDSRRTAFNFQVCGSVLS